MNLVTNLLGKIVRTPTQDETESWDSAARYNKTRKRWLDKQGEVVAVYIAAPAPCDHSRIGSRVRLIISVTKSDTEEGVQVGGLLDLSVSLCTVCC